MLEKKQLWLVIAGLILVNCLTVTFFLTNPGRFTGGDEVVATVGKEKVTRQDWLTKMEEQYGESVLRDLVDTRVIEAMANKYKIKISEKAIDRELLMIKTMYGSSINHVSNEEKWKEQIKNNLLLEELLTKDVMVSDEELKSYYEQNRSVYRIPTSYNISHIVVNEKKEAEQVVEELKQGSNFATLAMEKSEDVFSANEGGHVGYISEEDDRFSEGYLNVVRDLKTGNWSKPIQTEEGYVVVMLHEKIEGKEFAFKEVKDQIRRQIALEQMDVAASASAFWEEVNVDWFYDKKPY